ncbi:MAG TPA: hypothetical protein VGC51_00830 [Hansschlegelia sp.]
MPYNIITEDGRRRIHHARTAREALEVAAREREAHPDLRIISSEGTVLPIDRLELMARAEDMASARPSKSAA